MQNLIKGLDFIGADLNCENFDLRWNEQCGRWCAQT